MCTILIFDILSFNFLFQSCQVKSHYPWIIWIMPVEQSQDTPLVQFHHPSIPSHRHHFLPCFADGLDLVAGAEDLCLSSTAGHIAAAAALNLDNNDNLISTHSPPLINLSPNLSPSSETNRVSPFYDFRETTRRRSAQGKNCYDY